MCKLILDQGGISAENRRATKTSQEVGKGVYFQFLFSCCFMNIVLEVLFHLGVGAS